MSDSKSVIKNGGIEKLQKMSKCKLIQIVIKKIKYFVFVKKMK